MVRRFGEWSLFRNLSKRLIDGTVNRTNKQILQQIGLRAEKMAVKFIQQQNLSWAPLSEKYIARKAAKGFSTKIYVRSSEYFQNVTSNVSGNTAFAGVMAKVRDKDGNIIADRARVLEYGSVKMNIPPRRLWLPVFQHMRQWLIKEKIFAVETVKNLRGL